MSIAGVCPFRQLCFFNCLVIRYFPCLVYHFSFLSVPDSLVSSSRRNRFTLFFLVRSHLL
jgi:hypothetical protein